MFPTMRFFIQALSAKMEAYGELVTFKECKGFWRMPTMYACLQCSRNHQSFGTHSSSDAVRRVHCIL